MIFAGRLVDEISDEEIAQLVEAHVSERQHLEFKATFEYRDAATRMELLRDVVSMANRRRASEEDLDTKRQPLPRSPSREGSLERERPPGGGGDGSV